MAQADNDNNMNITGNVMVTSLVNPKFTSVARINVVRFIDERREYEQAMKAECRRHGRTFKKMCVRLRDSFQPVNYLAACLRSWGLHWQWDETNVPDRTIWEKLFAIAGEPEDEEEPDMVKPFDGLTLALDGSSVADRALNFIFAAEKAMRDNALLPLMMNQATKKVLIGNIVKRIQPAKLKAKISNGCLQQMAKSDDFGLGELETLVAKHLRAYKQGKETFDAENTGAKRKATDGNNSERDAKRQMTQPAGYQGQGKPKWDKSGAKPPFKRGPGGRQWGQKITEEPREGAKPPPTMSGKSKPDAGGVVPTGCWICRDPSHRVLNCPKASADAKKKAMNKYGPMLKANKQARSGVYLAQGRLFSLEHGYSPLTINGVMSVPFLPDTGSTLNIIPRWMLAELKKLQPDLVIILLDQPMTGETASGEIMEMWNMVHLHLQIHTAAGVVNITGQQPCYVTPNGNEFLLSDQVLKSLGIDMGRLLKQVAESQNDQNEYGDDLEGDDFELGEAFQTLQVDTSGDTARLDEQDTDAVEDMLTRATTNGFPSEHQGRLRSIVKGYDIWRAVFRGTDPPAKVEPMKITLKSDAVPYVCKGRKLNALEGRFVTLFGEQMIRDGVIRYNDRSAYCSPVNPVRKPSGQKLTKSMEDWSDDDLLKHFRLTIDYRRVNSMTVPMAAYMPFLAVVMVNLKDAKYFAAFDFVKGFWQLPLHEDSQELLSFLANNRVCTPSRVMQGPTDSALFFQSTMVNAATKEDLLYKLLLIWIDDVLVFAKTTEKFLDGLDRFFGMCDKYGFKLSPKKCTLYKEEIKWCGRYVNGQGVHHDPERVAALCALPYPTNGGQLQQFVCACNWMRDSVPDFARLSLPLQERLDVILAGRKRTKRVASAVAIKLTTMEMAAWDKVKKALVTSVELAHPDDKLEMCLFTDASNEGWSILITQVTDFKDYVPIHEQQHAMLLCTSGTYKGPQLKWTVMEREAYPIARSCQTLDYLLMRPRGFRLYTDHKNLIHIFAPGEEWKAHTRGKLLRWAEYIGCYRYVIEHIEGVHNVWADMMSRWAGQPSPSAPTSQLVESQVELDRLVRLEREKVQHGAQVGALRYTQRKQHKTPRVPQVTLAPLRPLDREGFVWPTMDDVVQAQQAVQAPRDVVMDTTKGCLTKNNCIWIPPEAMELRQRILIVAHCGSMGHRGADAMRLHLKRLFWISNLSNEIQDFLKTCVLCPHVKGGELSNDLTRNCGTHGNPTKDCTSTTCTSARLSLGPSMSSCSRTTSRTSASWWLATKPVLTWWSKRPCGGPRDFRCRWYGSRIKAPISRTTSWKRWLDTSKSTTSSSSRTPHGGTGQWSDSTETCSKSCA